MHQEQSDFLDKKAFRNLRITLLTLQPPQSVRFNNIMKSTNKYQLVTIIFFAHCLQLILPHNAIAGVSNHSRNISITLFTENPNFHITTKSNINEKEEIIQKPNTEAVDGLQIAFGDKFSLSASTKRTPNPDDIALYGNTKYQDFRLQFLHQSLFINSYYQSYSGYYIDNSYKIDPSLTKSDPQILNAGLNSQMTGLNIFYIFEPNQYSLPAALYQSAKQTSSGGSLIMGLSVSDFLFNTEDYLIPSSQHSLYGSDASINKGHFSAFAATLGYGYTFVFSEKFFLSGILLLGSGQESLNYDTSTDNFKKTAKALKTDSVISLGFNGDLMFVGMTLTSDNTNHYTHSLTLNTGLSVFNLHFGLRF